jgi:hypothetical protein
MAAGEAGRGHLRASHTDREHVIGVLKAAFVQGRLTKDELDARVGQTLASRTYGELAALTADLPAGLNDTRLPRQAARARAQPPMNNAAKAGVCVAIAVTVAVLASIPTDGAALALFVPFYFIALLAAGAQMLVNRYDNRSRRGQLPPAPGGHAAGGGQSGQPGADQSGRVRGRPNRGSTLLSNRVMPQIRLPARVRTCSPAARAMPVWGSRT